MSRDAQSLVSGVDSGLNDTQHEGQQSRHARSRSEDRAQIAGATPSQRNHAESEREESLRREIEKVRGVNNVVEKVIQSLEKSRDNLSTVNNSVQSASTLLDTWTRILSQTEHNQRLLLDPEWRGASADMEEMENESMLRQQAAERRAIEEEMRREASLRAAEEDERKRSATPSSSRGRTRGRGVSSSIRGPSSRGSTASVGNTGRRTTSSARVGSGIGRGVAGGRGRVRGP